MRMLDLFSGIGGFHKGFEQAGYEFEWVGFSEIDKYASAVYKHRFPNAKELGDISAIRPERDLPDHINLICGGFPCQAFSQAGKRKGFDDTRGTLFFEIARILRHYIETGKPIDYFVLENVKGLLSHDDGRTFAVIYGVLTDLGYTVECQLLNTRWVLPQNRERIYIVGHIGRGSTAKVFPITEDDKRHYEEQLSRAQAKGQGQGVQHAQDRRGCALPGDGQVNAVLTPNRVEKRQNGRRMKEDGEPMFTLTGQDQHGVMLGYTRDAKGKVIKRSEQPHANTLHSSTGHGGNTDQFVKIKEATSKGYAVAQEGDSINFCNPNSKTRRGRVGKGIAQTLDTGMEQATIINKKGQNKNNQDYAATLAGGGNSGGNHSDMDLLHYNQTNIRRLTPIECERLQGFPDQWTAKGNLNGKVVDISDTQRYKQCGNAVSVPIVQLVANQIKRSE
tara:strand:- start:1334 stop:2674 length:1341 start_codon:yes stop_codon:yes gene_type:complete